MDSPVAYVRILTFILISDKNTFNRDWDLKQMLEELDELVR